MENKLQLVAKEIESDLRKTGFDWCNESPTLDLVCKWFRDVRGYYINVITEIGYDKINLRVKPMHRGIVNKIDEWEHLTITKTSSFDNYEDAIVSAILQFLPELSIKDYQSNLKIKSEIKDAISGLMKLNTIQESNPIKTYSKTDNNIYERPKMPKP